MSNRNQNVLAAHSVLEYLLTKAGMTGETKTMQIRIPHKELVPESQEYDDVDLVLTLETDWEQTQDGETDVTEA